MVVQKMQVKPSFSFKPYLSNRRPMGGGCLQSSASKCRRGSYEKMCVSAPAICGTDAGGLTLASVRLIAKVNTSWSVTTLTLNNIAGTPSSILAVCRADVFARDGEAENEARQNHNPWPKDRRYVHRRVQDGRRRGARVLSAKGARDCRPGALSRQDTLWTHGAGRSTDPFTGLLLARTPRWEQYQVRTRASRSEATPP